MIEFHLGQLEAPVLKISYVLVLYLFFVFIADTMKFSKFRQKMCTDLIKYVFVVSSKFTKVCHLKKLYRIENLEYPDFISSLKRYRKLSLLYKKYRNNVFLFFCLL